MSLGVSAPSTHPGVMLIRVAEEHAFPWTALATTMRPFLRVEHCRTSRCCESLLVSDLILGVVNRPRFGCYSLGSMIQLDCAY